MYEIKIHTGNESEKGAVMKKYLALFTSIVLLLISGYVYPADFEGVKTITLTQEQLKKMGVTVYNDRIEAYASDKIKLIIRTDKIDIISNFRDKPFPGTCCPRFVVNSFKKGSSSYFHKISDYYAYESNSVSESRNFNGLVCVRVDAVITGRKSISGNSVFFWYDCTEELIKLLPTYTKVELMAELYDSSGVNTEEHSYTDMYRNKSGVLSDASVRPNPVYYDSGELDFTLAEKRSISISMYDISGNMRKAIVSDTFFEKGSHSLKIDLTDYADGMYVIVITTGNNELLTQRLIKTR